MNTYYGNMYRYQPVLVHHGIKGQKWGVRRFQNEDGSLTAAGQRRYDIDEAKSAYKQAKREYKQIKKQTRVKGIIAGRQYQKMVETSDKLRSDAEMKVVDAKAALAKARKGEKGEMKSYIKSMRKYGLSGSIMDAQSGGKSTKLYDHIAAKKGESYAMAAERKMKKQLITSAVVATVAGIGMSVASAYMES